MKKKTKDRINIALFIAFIGGFFLLQMLTPDRSFSERENRYLQTLPEFSFKALFEGEYTKDFEDFTADQFPFRDAWITLNARYELLSGKQQTNGVFLCEGDRLITPFSSPTASALQRRVKAVELMQEKLDVPVVLGLIPNAAELYGELLPSGAPNDSQAELIRQVDAMTELTTADLLTPLKTGKATERSIFYRTDHHWTTYGAYWGYVGLCGALGLEPVPLSNYTEEMVSENFFGTSYSSSGYTWVSPDTIESYVPAEAATRLVTYQGTEGKELPLYKEEALSVKDKYTYFLGGNTPRSVLFGTDETLPKLLLIRDSYSDSLAPFLLAHYSEIHLLDMRYYLGSPAQYALDNAVDQVAVLYSVENFCEQNGVLAMAE